MLSTQMRILRVFGLPAAEVRAALRAVQARARGERPSVREELRGIKAMLHATEAMAPKLKVPIRIHRGDRAR